MRLLRITCVLALALCLATSVYAGTQSVKISGDLTIRSLARGDFDQNHNHEEPDNPGTAVDGANPYSGTSDWQTYFMSSTELQVDADLTDNVSAVVRLFNQRDWGVDANVAGTGTTIANVNLGAIYTPDPDEFDIGVDLAYIELKEFLYSPLTLKIGRQDLWFGKGFIVGALQRDYNANILANEYTVQNSFDAIRATLDYDPWTIDAIYSKIWEHVVDSEDDEDLYGLNVGYVFDSYNAEAEAYYFVKDDRGTVLARDRKQHNRVFTMGMRGSFDPIENWTVAAEGAYQMGHFIGFRDQLEKRDRSGFAIDASLECRHFKEQYAWKPVMGVEYIIYSGDEDDYPSIQSSGTWEGWDPMYRGKFDTAYREFVGVYHNTYQGAVGARADFMYPATDTSVTNQQQILVKGSVMPTDSLTVDMRGVFFWQMYRRSFLRPQLDPGAAGLGTELSKRPSYLGTEIDLQLTWDYTEDVSFGLLAAWFFPGNFYYEQADDAATDVVGTVKLSF